MEAWKHLSDAGLMKSGDLSPLPQLRTGILQGNGTQKPSLLRGNCNQQTNFIQIVSGKQMAAGVLSDSPFLSPLRGKHQSCMICCQVPHSYPGWLSCWDFGIMFMTHFSFPKQAPSSFLPRRKDRAGLAHEVFPSLQLSCFNINSVFHYRYQKAEWTGFCVSRSAGTPLGVLLSRPSRSRCRPWKRSE